jgi:hypothetical protein
MNKIEFFEIKEKEINVFCTNNSNEQYIGFIWIDDKDKEEIKKEAKEFKKPCFCKYNGKIVTWSTKCVKHAMETFNMEKSGITEFIYNMGKGALTKYWYKKTWN